MSLRELLNPFLASANTRSCLWSPPNTPEQALFFRLGTLHLIGQQLPMHAHTQPLSVTLMAGLGDTPTLRVALAHGLMVHPWLTAPLYGIKPKIVCRPWMGAFPVRRHPIYSTFFRSWQVFAALFLKIFLLMWENTNKHRYFQGKKLLMSFWFSFVLPSFLKCQVCRMKGFAL